MLCREAGWLRGNCCSKGFIWQGTRQPELLLCWRRQWGAAEMTKDSEPSVQSVLRATGCHKWKLQFLSTSSRLDFLLPHHHLYRGSEKADVPCWKVIATASFDWALHYVELRTLLFMKRHPRKLQRRMGKKLQVLILIRGACLPGVRCLSVKSRR